MTEIRVTEKRVTEKHVTEKLTEQQKKEADRTPAASRSTAQRGTEDIMQAVVRRFALPAQDLRGYSPQTLAYIGDAVYEIAVRSLLVAGGNAPVNKLHRKASRLSRAERQSEIVRAVKKT